MSDASPAAVPTADRPRIWFDVEDLFHFAARNARPTGIQRVCFEIYRAAMADPALAARIGFLRHATIERGFIEADWRQLELLFSRVTDRQDPPEPASVDAIPPVGEVAIQDAPIPVATVRAARGWRATAPARLARRATGVVPEALRRPAILFTVMQLQAAAALAATAGWGAVGAARRGGAAGLHRLGRARRRLTPRLPPGDPVELAAALRLADIARRGDILAVLGSPWFELDYAELAAHVRGRLGMRLAVLLHDVIPVRRPEWVDRGTTRVYRDWYMSVLPLADAVFANSRATAADVTLWCRRDNIALREPVTALPLGTGFGLPAAPRPIAADVPSPDPLTRALKGRPYVLFVSTIEARKNHMLLFRVWRRLMEEMPAERLPDLVFVGKVGWMVRDLMDQIENSDRLDGRLHVVEGLDDDELRAAYAGCLFTVFPSHYEGWGLPVTESLAAGKPCIASNTTSLPEAGGTLARYFDPTDLNDATRTIRDAIENEAGLAAWQARVQAQFRPVAWHETARALVAALDALA